MPTAQTAVTISEEGLNVVLDNSVMEQSTLSARRPSGMRLQQLIESSLDYSPQYLTCSQFATLQAISRLLARPASGHLAAHLNSIFANSAAIPSSVAPSGGASDLPLGLDELEMISRTRAGYAFIDLPPELQEAVLSLIASRDLTTRRLDLALWLEHLLLHSVKNGD